MAQKQSESCQAQSFVILDLEVVKDFQNEKTD